MSNLSKYEKLLYKHNRLKRHCGSQMNKIVEYKQELQRKDNNWNELKKYLEKEIAEWQDVDNIPTRARVEEDKDILDKIKELESK